MYFQAELEEANKENEIEIQDMSQELESTEIYFQNLEEKLKENEHFLLQKSLLVQSESDELQNVSIQYPFQRPDNSLYQSAYI